ncbi:unnamed protein product [Urochloa decumbens]|uniref:GDSL esterase/lipase n=1 Tax=Urochloa decumbens TaxID=240449 RepID=A0ABC8ZRP9_9POAL
MGGSRNRSASYLCHTVTPTLVCPAPKRSESKMGELLPPRAAVSLLLPLLLLFTSPEAVTPATAPPVRRRYESIFSFGDSFADTGNGPAVFRWHSIPDPAMRPPYGSTFFGRPTGRNCDGRLAIDFLAESMGLPLVPPFLAHNGSFRAGANFAVAGATALDASLFRGPFNTSLNVQLQWFESLKSSLCGTAQECKEFFRRSLFVMGEFGFNDYTISFYNKSVQQVRSLVPDVIRTISMATKRFIKHGVTNLVVTGMPPLGCTPPVLVRFDADSDQARYNPRTGCLDEVNELAINHNSLLVESLEKIRAKNPEVEIIYADFFGPIMEMVESPRKFGFEGDVLTVCCGGPGRYHYSQAISCGDPGASKCEDPSARLFWDGAHLTEAANRYVANDWLSSINPPAMQVPAVISS